MVVSKPIISLKNIQHNASLSEETYCYSATVYVDGKRWGTTGNRGHGGCDDPCADSGGWEAVKELDDRIKATYEPIPFEMEGMEGQTYDPTLETICSGLVTEFLIKKDFKRTLKKICYVKPDEIGLYVLKAKFKPTPDMMAKVRECDWAEGCTFLNELPEEEALELYKKHG